MATLQEVMASLADATSDLIQATYPMSDADLCEDRRVVAFIHAVNRYADATLGLLNAINYEEDANAVA